MKFSERFLKDEKGVAIIIAMFVLVILTLIGIAATRTSNIEQQIAAYDANYKQMFYNADSGIQWALGMLQNSWVDQTTASITPCYPGNCDGINPRPQEFGDQHRFTQVPSNMPFDLYLYRIINSDPWRVEVMSVASETTSGRGTVEATVTAALDIGMEDYGGSELPDSGDQMSYN